MPARARKARASATPPRSMGTRQPRSLRRPAPCNALPCRAQGTRDRPSRPVHLQSARYLPAFCTMPRELLVASPASFARVISLLAASAQKLKWRGMPWIAARDDPQRPVSIAGPRDLKQPGFVLGTVPDANDLQRRRVRTVDAETSMADSSLLRFHYTNENFDALVKHILFDGQRGGDPDDILLGRANEHSPLHTGSEYIGSRS